jgi:hypothetical protein
MKDIHMQDARPDRESFSPRMYSANLQPLLQSLLATLADIDFAYERERERISKNSNDLNLKIRVLERLKSQHRERREPYMMQLAELQKQLLV